MKGEERSQPDYQYRVLTSNGTVRWADSRSVTISWEGKPATLNFITDFTERKLTDAKLRQQTDAMDAATDGMALLNAEGEYVYINKAHAGLYGYEKAEELIGKSWRILYDSDVLQRFDQEIMPEFSRKGDWHGEAVGTKKNGAKFPQELSLTAMTNGGLICVVRDITERKQAEEQIYRANAFLDSIVENIPNMIFLKEAGNLRFVRFNRAGEDLLGYSRNDLLGKNDYDFFPKEQADREVLHGKEVVDIPEEPLQTRNKGERTMHTKKVPILDVNGEPEYLLGISEDITEQKRAEEQLQQTLESLRKAVGTTIQVIASTVEARDPYTSGHQIRSADLARAIAMEMGLPQDKIDAIRMAGSIHDIGKLSIPAEILSKPTKLSEIEFSLIKEHARKGYEMLKDVESPWPLAEVIYQHHERIDGSGYPRNLKGNEIMIEARILSVADVVEAMASHRPYRPGLGIDAALNEIEKNKGIFYDNDVADACLRLFREKGFKLAVA
jgi:PAS domain S-box-containing protein